MVNTITTSIIIMKLWLKIAILNVQGVFHIAYLSIWQPPKAMEGIKSLAPILMSRTLE